MTACTLPTPFKDPCCLVKGHLGPCEPPRGKHAANRAWLESTAEGAMNDPDDEVEYRRRIKEQQ